jgi:hypothetical protein
MGWGTINASGAITESNVKEVAAKLGIKDSLRCDLFGY